MVVVRVVDQDDVHAVELQPFEARLERPHHAVVREVEHRRVRIGPLEEVAQLRARGLGLEHTSDLRRDDEVVPRHGRQHLAEHPLRVPEPVERRGVEEPHAGVPRALHGGDALLERDGVRPATERRRAEPEPRDLKRRLPHACRRERIQGHALLVMRNDYIRPRKASSARWDESIARPM